MTEVAFHLIIIFKTETLKMANYTVILTKKAQKQIDNLDEATLRP